MLIHWSPNPIALSLGPLAIHWYGLFWAAAFLLGDWIANRELKYIGKKDVDISSIAAWILICTILGARLAHCLFYDPSYYLAHPLRIFAIWEGGLASHGGVVGFIFGLWMGARKNDTGLSMLALLDLAAIPAALGGALVRMANFINSEIVGIPTGGDWGVVFERIDAIPRHPVQLYESIVYFLLFIALALKFRKRPDQVGSGVYLGWFMLVVFSARFVLEFWKTPQAEYEANYAITVGQWLSVPFMVWGAWLLLRAKRSDQKTIS